MALIQITVELPEDLAQQAAAEGLLQSARLGDLLRSELARARRAEAGQQLLAAMNTLHTVAEPLDEETTAHLVAEELASYHN